MVDVAIVGAGPVGTLLAVMLADMGIESTVFEARRHRSSHSRAIGIHPPALEVLEQAGIAEGALRSGVRIERGLGYSRGRLLGELSFDTAGAPGRFILSLPQARTQELLDDALEHRAPGTIRFGCSVADISRRSGRFLLRCDDETAHSARIVIGADGPRGATRSLFNGVVDRRVYRDEYLMGDFADDGRFGTTAVLFLEPDGVVESFPLPGMVRRWVVRLDRRDSEHSAHHLTEVIARRTGVRLDPATSTMLSRFRPVRSFVRGAAGDGLLLVGDAAHEISPIGGQGMTLGWLDAAAAAEATRLTLATGDPTPFRRVAAARQSAARRAAMVAELNMALGRDQSPTTIAMRDGFIRLLVRRPFDGLLARTFSMQL